MLIFSIALRRGEQPLGPGAPSTWLGSSPSIISSRSGSISLIPPGAGICLLP